MRILRVRLDLQGRLTPVSALGVVSVEKKSIVSAICSDSVCVKLSLLFLSSIIGFVRSAGGWLCGYSFSSLAFPYYSSHKWRSDI